MSEAALVPSDIRRSEVDGIPVFWTPHATRFVGRLMFRVGRADETLIGGGLTHLVEHLALFGLGTTQAYAFDGAVELLRTTFQAAGTPEELVQFFRHVCGELRALPLDRVKKEARVLLTEEAGRQSSPTDQVLRLRYGPHGPGLVFYRELGIRRAEPSAVMAWAAEHFTAGNAAAWFSGPIPPGLGFDLPGGPRRPAEDPRPIRDLTLPAWFPGPSGGVTLSLVGPRADWLSVPAGIAVERVQHTLRFVKGLTYGAGGGHFPLSRDLAHMVIVATALDQHAKAVQDEILDVLSAMASDGPTEAELARMIAQFERSLAEPDSVLNELDSRAFNELLGAPEQSFHQLLEEMRLLAPASAATALRQALNTALLMVPEVSPCTSPAYARYAIPSLDRVAGASHRSTKTPFPWSRNKVELIVGELGVSWCVSNEADFTILYSQLAAAVELPEGGLWLLDRYGKAMNVLPSEWREGSRAVSRIRSALPADRFVPQDE